MRRRERARIWLIAIALPIVVLALAAGASPPPVPPTSAAALVIGSKNFAESRLLAEMFAQLLEERTELKVDRRFNLAGTQICFNALRQGEIDLYPEYTGTAWSVLLEAEGSVARIETLVRVRAEFLRRWDLHWLGPLGFENAYELAVARPVAERLGLRTITDLVPHAANMTAGFGYEFAERGDGLPGLKESYGLQFGTVRTMQQAIKYQAAGAGELACIDAYTTDGRLLVNDLVILEDDRGFFPPYEAAPLAYGPTIAEHPEVGAVLALLSGAIDEQRMRGWNLRLQERNESPARVAHDALVELGLREGGEAFFEERAAVGFFAYLWSQRSTLLQRLLEHLGLTLVALLLAIVVAVPLGLWLSEHGPSAEWAIRLVGTTQTIPSLALLALMIPFLGIHVSAAIVALWLYALYPILRNTYSGLRDADPRAVDSAHALGMTYRQVLWHVRFPLATPVLMTGVRVAAVTTVGTATLAAFIGAGGLGEPIIAGLQLANVPRILSGAIPAALLALCVDLLLGGLERAIRPRGLERRVG